MKLLLERKYKKDSYTIGSLSITPPLGALGASWCADTLEPPIGTEVEMRTAGSKKAIPPGTYLVKLAWSQRFQEYLPRLEDIPGTSPPKVSATLPFRGGQGRGSILIHAGNSVKDTVGCILVGKNTRKGKLTDSRLTLANLLALIRQAINSGESVTLEIK